jgi:hypothetical protein
LLELKARGSPESSQVSQHAVDVVENTAGINVSFEQVEPRENLASLFGQVFLSSTKSLLVDHLLKEKSILQDLFARLERPKSILKLILDTVVCGLILLPQVSNDFAEEW